MMSEHDAVYICGDCRGCLNRYPGCYDLRVGDLTPIPPERLAAEEWRQRIAAKAARRKPTTKGQGEAALVAAVICFAVLGGVALAVWVVSWL